MSKERARKLKFYWTKCIIACNTLLPESIFSSSDFSLFELSSLDIRNDFAFTQTLISQISC